MNRSKRVVDVRYVTGRAGRYALVSLKDSADDVLLQERCINSEEGRNISRHGGIGSLLLEKGHCPQRSNDTTALQLPWPGKATLLRIDQSIARW